MELCVISFLLILLSFYSNLTEGNCVSIYLLTLSAFTGFDDLHVRCLLVCQVPRRWLQELQAHRSPGPGRPQGDAALHLQQEETDQALCVSLRYCRSVDGEIGWWRGCCISCAFVFCILCRMCFVYCTVCNLHAVQCVLVFCVFTPSLYVLYSVYCAVCICILHTVYCAVRCVLCILCSMYLCTVQYVFSFCMLCSKYLYSAYCAVCICILPAVQYVFVFCLLYSMYLYFV